MTFLTDFRSEEHTSELQSQSNLVCRLLLEKKNNLIIPLHQLNVLSTLITIMVSNKYAFLQITRMRILHAWYVFKQTISSSNILRSITITLVIIMRANKYAFLQITRRRFLHQWEASKNVISRRNIRRRITIPMTLSNLKLISRITRTENIFYRNSAPRQVPIHSPTARITG